MCQDRNSHSDGRLFYPFVCSGLVNQLWIRSNPLWIRRIFEGWPPAQLKIDLRMQGNFLRNFAKSQFLWRDEVVSVAADMTSGSNLFPG